eukprot:6154735-Pyramimonas_sp.AAC.1
MALRRGASFRPARGAAEHVPRPGAAQPRWAGELARQLARPQERARDRWPRGPRTAAELSKRALLLYAALSA